MGLHERRERLSFALERTKRAIECDTSIAVPQFYRNINGKGVIQFLVFPLFV
jgi:hypothetical protein